MIIILRSLLGKTVQVATPLDLAEGVLVAVDEACLTLRTSGTGGYDKGQHAVFPFHHVSYVRVCGQDEPVGAGV